MSDSRTKCEFFPLSEVEPRSTTVDPVRYGEGYQPVRADLGAAVTVQPCPSNTPTTYVERTPNHFVLTFVTLCLCTCCWPAVVFAILGVIYSVQVDGQWINKDYAGAQRSSHRAKLWSIAGMVAGGLVVTAYMLLFAISILVGPSSTDTEQENEYPSQ